MSRITASAARAAAPEPSTADSRSTRKAGLPNGVKTMEASQDSSVYVGIARRMGDAEHRPDGLELAGVPEGHVGQQRAQVEREGGDEDGQHGHDAGEGDGPFFSGCRRIALVEVRTRVLRRRRGRVDRLGRLAHHPLTTPQ